MRRAVQIGLVVLALLAALYVYPFFVPLPERAGEPIVPPFPAEYGAAAIADLAAAEQLYRDGDFKSAHDLWKPLAESGNPEAQFRIGRLYDRGIHVEQNTTKALDFYELAYVAQHPAATFRIASLIEDQKEGECAADNLRYLEQAASWGHPGALRDLGHMHKQGVCVPVSLEKSLNYSNAAASQGDWFSNIILTQIYSNGGEDIVSGEDAYFYFLVAKERFSIVVPFIYGMALLASTNEERVRATQRYVVWQPVLIHR